jgi:hypothetical protein
MRSILLAGLPAVCLSVGLATVGLWVRSYYVADHYVWAVRSTSAGFNCVDSRAIETVPGRIVFRERTAVM